MGDIDTHAPDAEEQLITLPPKARGPEIESLLADIRAVPSRTLIVFDGSRVETMSTPLALLMLSTLKSREDQSPPAAVLNPTPAIVDGFSDLGLFKDLMKMEFRT